MPRGGRGRGAGGPRGRARRRRGAAGRRHARGDRHREPPPRAPRAGPARALRAGARRRGRLGPVDDQRRGRGRALARVRRAGLRLAPPARRAQVPFLPPAPDTDRAGHDTAVHWLERDLIRHEGVARGLEAYRAALAARSRRLGRWSRAQRRTVHALLERMERAARPLQRLHDGRRHPPARHVAALRQSLARAGIDHCLAGDAAGERVRAVLARLDEAAAGRDVRLGWDDFRTWCGRALEQEHFVPPAAAGPVVLADLARAADLPCDRLVLAGADAEHLPGAPGGSPFFNDAVRAELGLPTWPERWRLQLHRFRRALGLAGSVVFTHARERGGEPLAPSPWVELLTTFHELAFGRGLGDAGLAAAAAAFDAHHAAPLPPPTRQPRPPAPPERLPARLSAGRHQELVACPYRFFAGSCLGLEPPEEIREELQKAEYGERLHRALQAFWTPVAGMPGPWEGPLEPDRRVGAVAHLEHLIDAAFAGDLEGHFAHRAWHLRARALAPALVDWAIGRAARTAFEAAEVSAERTLPGGPTLRGRLDRVDRTPAGAAAVVDYKTGRVPAAAELRSGEDVQLATYALVGDDVAAVAYLALERERCRETALEGEDLAALARAVEARLADVWERLARGAPMPAWVNAGCSWCRWRGCADGRRGWPTRTRRPGVTRGRRRCRRRR
ncbi:MAG: PD-(D/E)XK nuclease family protein [Halofilum sp. (in: g-proteobacteria)]|nr:PD-(D/E)XK nuclease family protein [Halofilum sp. (in: g-proteobacteria)]